MFFITDECFLFSEQSMASMPGDFKKKGYKFMKEPVLLFLFLLCTLPALSGCSKVGGENLLENGDFTLWDDSSSMPVGWSLEGQDISVAKSDEVVDETGDGSIAIEFSSEGFGLGAPFIYQSIKDINNLRGREIVLGAWVKTSTPDAVAIEYSDRAGVDVRSPYHPGDGKWRYLELTYLLPDKAIRVEYRLRLYAPAKALVAGAVLKRSSWWIP